MLLIHRASTPFRSVARRALNRSTKSTPLIRSASIAKLRSTAGTPPLVWRPEPAAWPLPQWPARALGPGSGCWVGKSGCWRRRPSTCEMPSTVRCVWDIEIECGLLGGCVRLSVYIANSVNQPSTQQHARHHPRPSRRLSTGALGIWSFDRERMAVGALGRDLGHDRAVVFRDAHLVPP